MYINSTSMQSHQMLMNINANNIANVNNDDYNATEGRIGNDLVVSNTKTEQSTDITKEITNQISIENGFELQTSIIQTQEAMIGTLLNLKG